MKIIKRIIKDIKSFTIDRKKWVRGGKGGNSRLLNSKGNMCCLGQYAKACGFTNKEIFDKSEPADLGNLLKPNLNKMWLANKNQEDIEIVDWKTMLVYTEMDDYLEDMIVHNRDNTYNLMNNNDSTYLDDGNTIMPEKEREKRIKAGFAKIGVKVKFKN